MINKTKFILSLSILSLGILSITPKESKATLRNRITGALYRICGACFERRGISGSSSSSNLPLIPTDESNLNQNSLINDNEGAGLSRSLTRSLNLETARSRSSSIDSNSLEESNINQLVSISNKPEETLIKNLTISSRLKEKKEEILKMPLVGERIDSINIEEFGGIDKNNYYHQHKTGDKIVSLVSVSEPHIIDASDDKGKVVQVLFLNNSDELKTITTSALPIWYKGEEIIKKMD